MIVSSRSLARGFLGLCIVVGGVIAYFGNRNVTLMSAAGGGLVGLTIAGATWHLKGQPARSDAEEFLGRPEVGGCTFIVVLVAMAALGAGIVAGSYYLTQWNPMASGAVYGVLGGLVIGSQVPRAVRDFCAPVQLT
jgi:hypothetical protein